MATVYTSHFLTLGKNLLLFCGKAGTDLIGCRRHLLSDADKVGGGRSTAAYVASVAIPMLRPFHVSSVLSLPFSFSSHP